MLMILAKLFKALNSESAPGQIALAVALGSIAGLTPLMSAHNIIVVFLACIIRVNFTAFLLAITLFSGIAYMFDPIMANIGEQVLTNQDLYAFWTGLYQSDFWRVTHFNNTLVMGSLIFALIAFLPILLISRWLVISYRERIMASIEKWKIVQMLKASKFYRLYQTIAD